MVACVLTLSWSVLTPAATFRDALGREVSLKSSPKRIVSMAPSLTEILYYLGLGERVVGVTQFSYFPPEAGQKPKVGSYINLNVEKIISLDPDLAVGTVDGNRPGVVKLLDQAGIPVYLVNPRSVRDAIKTVASLGRLCGARKKAEDLSYGLYRRMDRVFQKTVSLRHPVVFLQINIRPIMTVNRNTIHNDVIRLAGGVNLSRDEPMTYPTISVEEIIQRRPEVIIISSMERGGRFEAVKRRWLKWPDIPAAKTGRIYLVESDLLDRPSPRIVKGLEIMGRLIHPEVKWEE